MGVLDHPLIELTNANGQKHHALFSNFDGVYAVCVSFIPIACVNLGHGYTYTPVSSKDESS